jgi:hypothetical protein
MRLIVIRFLSVNSSMDPHPFENLKRVETPTTYIDEARVARVPKRTDMFARAQFRGHGQKPTRGGQGRLLRAQGRAILCAAARIRAPLFLLQDGEANENGARL